MNATAGTFHENANVISTTIGGGLSMLGVAFILLSYVRVNASFARHDWSVSEKMLLCISTSDFLSAATSVLGVWFPSENNSCKTEGFLIIFATTSSFFWTSCLATHLFLVLTRQNPRNLMTFFHVACWCVPLTLASSALAGKALGNSPHLAGKKYIKLTTGGWCWIKDFGDKSKTITWTLMTSKFWELASYLLITILCLAILLKLRSTVNSSTDLGQGTMAAARKVERRMLFIPVAFILLRVWGTVRYFAYVSELSVRSNVLENMPLYALQGLGDSSQGAANSVFFCISNKRVRTYWRNVISKHCAFLFYTEDEELDENSPLLHKTKQLKF